MARGYGQYCGLARALGVVGDRWNLLIVRQLLMGPARYGELRDGLAGIATNLLTDEQAQIVGIPPVGASVLDGLGGGEYFFSSDGCAAA